MNVLSSLLNFIGNRISVDYMHPVGSYYETSDTGFDPNIAWGGTWVLEAEGMVHVSGSVNGTYRITKANNLDGVGEKDGGSPTVALTTANLPAHSHTAYGSQYFVGSDRSEANNANVNIASSGTTRKVDGIDTSSAIFHHWRSTANTGSGTAHENMPPYIVINRWHRTA